MIPGSRRITYVCMWNSNKYNGTRTESSGILILYVILGCAVAWRRVNGNFSFLIVQERFGTVVDLFRSVLRA